MFYIQTAIKFLKKALVSLVLMKSFDSPRQHIPCGQGYFPPISDTVNSHRDSRSTCYSCCVSFFSKGTRNPAIQHIPLACTGSGGCQTKCQACKVGMSPELMVSDENMTSCSKGVKNTGSVLCLVSTCRLSVLSKSFFFTPWNPSSSDLVFTITSWFPALSAGFPIVPLAGFFFSPVC